MLLCVGGAAWLGSKGTLARRRAMNPAAVRRARQAYRKHFRGRGTDLRGQQFGKWLCCVPHPYYRNNDGSVYWIALNLETRNYDVISRNELRRAARARGRR